MDLRVSDLRQYLYCARIPHYYYVRPVQRKVTFKMARGQSLHDQMERLELRRTLKRYGLAEGERLFSVALSSETLRLSGICDLVVRTNYEDIPCEFKSSSSPNWSSHKYQLAAYGMLLEEQFRRPVRRGFLIWAPRGTIFEVSINDGVRRYLKRLIADIRREILQQSFPPPTTYNSPRTLRGLRVSPSLQGCDLMFFLSDEERQRLLRGLLPRSREQFVNPELRGWNWHQPPLQPSHEILMPLYLVAGRYCESGRDVYLQKVRKITPQPTTAMREGAVLHDVIRQVFTLAKKLIYTLGPGRMQEFEAQMGFENCRLPSQEFSGKAQTLWNFEVRRFSYRLEEILAKQPYIQEDALAYLTLPVVLEQKVDGSFLGLSPNLSCDAMVFGEPMIMEVKFGPPLPFYQYFTTGYAMVSEALYGHPVNLGCLIYPRFSPDGTRVTIKRDLHLITDELRLQFLEQRNAMSRIVSLELDPGLPPTCYSACPLWNHCHGDQEAPQLRNQKALERIRDLRATKIDPSSSIHPSPPAMADDEPPS